jgi:hypothetical protein
VKADQDRLLRRPVSQAANYEITSDSEMVEDHRLLSSEVAKDGAAIHSGRSGDFVDGRLCVALARE